MHSIFADDAGRHGTFTNQGIADKASSIHFRDAALNGRYQVALNDQCVARKHHLSEAHIFDSQEVRPIVFRIGDRIENQDTTDLRHGLYLQHAREHWIAREVTLEEVFIGSYILYTGNTLVV